jgi:hypothetical protein
VPDPRADGLAITMILRSCKKVEMEIRILLLT